MSYLVLARKKRPQIFEDVVGQRPITQTLQNAISQKRVAHAFLFTGPRGVGKTSTARILAKALNCEKGPQVNPCNECPACREISDGNSIDVIEIDGASNRGIDEIRELRDNVRYTPAKSRYKIFIIDEVHMLTPQAFNALLKTLEEPPSHIVFIFATTEPHKIPATVLSRCQRYDFRRISLDEIVSHLRHTADEEKIAISQHGLYTIARESEGSMRDAQSLLDRLISYGGNQVRDEEVVEVLGLIDQKILSDTIEAIADHDASRCLQVVDHIYQYGFDIERFCDELLQYLRNLILLKVSSHPEPFLELPEDQIASLKRQAEKFQLDPLNHLFDFLVKGKEEISQSTFPRIMLEMTLIRMASLHYLVPIDEIIKRLEDLEKGQGSISPPPSPIPKIAGAAPGQKADPSKGSQDKGPSREKLQIPSPKFQISEMARETTPDSNGEEVPEESPDEKKEEIWRGLVDFVRARDPVLGSSLALGGIVRLSAEQIEIGFEKDSFHYERMIEKQYRDKLNQYCKDFIKTGVKVVISPIERGSLSFPSPLGGGAPDKERLSPRRQDGEAELHPLILEAIRLFDGRIVKE